jgi:hypothetical protein
MTEMVIIPPYVSSGYTTTAKHYGDSVSNYFETGGGSVIGDSPLDWNGMIDAVNASDVYTEMTLVFSIYPLELSDDGNWYVFGSESGTILVGHWDVDGGIWVGARTFAAAIQQVNTTGDGAGDYAGMTLNEWNAIMIAWETTGGDRNIKMVSNGVEVYDGLFDDNDDALNPHSYNGYCWAGRGDGYSGPPERGMECYVSAVWCDEVYLDPDTYYSDFFDANYKPKDIGADGSEVTATQPHTYAPDGDLANNLGSGDDWDEVGTVPNAPISPTD